MSGTRTFAKDRTIPSVNVGTITFIMKGTTKFVKSREGRTVQFLNTGTMMFVTYSYEQYQKKTAPAHFSMAGYLRSRMVVMLIMDFYIYIYI